MFFSLEGIETASLICFMDRSMICVTIVDGNACVSDILAATVWTWWWAVGWVWTWTHILSSTTPLSCSDSPYVFSCSKVCQQFSPPLVFPATRIKNSCFFFWGLTPHLLPSSTFSAMFPVLLPVLDMLGFSLFARDSTAFLGGVVEKIKAERIKTSDQVRTKQEERWKNDDYKNK